MDGATEPIVAVIANPIAGNPSQFALERALVALDLDWRVLSFDVEQDAVSRALDGTEVLGLKGVYLDESVIEQATRWYQDRDSQFTRIDCLVRDDQSASFVGVDQKKKWLNHVISEHLSANESRELSTASVLWIGEEVDSTFINDTSCEVKHFSDVPDPEDIVAAEVVIIARDDSLEVEDWPKCEESTLVIDQTGGHSEIEEIRRRGYQILSPIRLQMGPLMLSLQQWTQRQVPEDVIHDAIEEFFAV